MDDRNGERCLFVTVCIYVIETLLGVIVGLDKPDVCSWLCDLRLFKLSPAKCG